MATIPRISRTQGLETGSVVQYPTGSPVGEALERAGKVGVDLVSRFQERQMRAESFDATLSFNNFRERSATDLMIAQQSMQPGATGFAEGFLNQFDQSSKQWIGTLPAGVRSEFEARLVGQREVIAREAARVELKERQSFEVQGISNRTEAAQFSVMRGGPDTLPLVEADLNDLIDRSTLPPAQREEAKRNVRSRLQETGFRSLPPEDQQRIAKGWGFGNVFSGSAMDRAMQLLRDKEGFRASTYWNVNADRVGYGSDTITDAQGNVRPVRRGDVINREDAERDLRRRTQLTFAGIESKVGGEAFGRLNANQQAALASVAYNYGSLPDSVAAAVQGGDAEVIARAIESLQHHNDGVNRNRRLSEAALARSIGEGPVAGVYDPDARFDAVPPDRRFLLAGAADTAVKKQAAQQAALVAQTYNDQFNALQTNIIDGKANLADVEKARQDGWLTDAGDIQRVLGQIANRDKGMADTTNFSKAFSEPGFLWNPADGDHKDWADAGFRSLGGSMEALEAVAGKSGIVPATAATALRGALFSADPARVQSALLAASNLIGGKHPDIFASVENGKELTNAALAFRHYAYDRGHGVEAATRRVMEERAPEYQRSIQAKIKSEDVNAIVKKHLSEVDIRNAFDTSWWPGTPKLTFSPEMRQRAMGDYEEAFRESYAQNGNIDLSRKLAREDMRKTWGVTMVNGSEVIMKFPPEKSPAYAGIEDVSKHISTQAITAIKEWNGADVDRTKLRLDEIKNTGQRFNRGEVPVYVLSYTDKDGLVQTIPKQFYADPKMLREQVNADRAARFNLAREADLARYDGGLTGIDIDRAPMGVRNIVAPISSVAEGLPAR